MNLFKDVRTGKASVKQRPSQLMLTCLASDHAFVVNPTFLAHPWNGTNKQNTTITKKPNTWEIRAAGTVLHALWSFPCCLVAGTSGLCKEVPWINYSDDLQPFPTGHLPNTEVIRLLPLASCMIRRAPALKTPCHMVGIYKLAQSMESLFKNLITKNFMRNWVACSGQQVCF